ncbi:Kelch repeat-containing protein [Engelhardtia mirabilis]|uniref:Kelch motif protein n=1 Tax=Engelhardtia mirabilis TaxID=2528011 RepID=A0A518BEN3_9BACT|nr:Kelch motif protein [Planctomycetes bacterium Pla133]QDU99766.1 Kelch motif protein [Planctomycetes bacterium Pla86]
MGRLPLRPLAALTAAALCASPAAAQLQLSFSDGVLGSAVDFALEGGAPGAAYVILPSFQVGPTPLSLLDPLDPRLLGVGLDLFTIATVGGLDGTGKAGASYGLPASPVLAGLPLFAQAVSLPGLLTLVDQVSNRTSFVLGGSGDVFPTLTADVARRAWHSASTLKDGRVLALGGVLVDPLVVGTPTARSSFFDPQTQSFSPAGLDLPTARFRHRAVTLDDGRILLSGGIGVGGVTAEVTLVDVASGTVANIAPMAQARVMHTMTKLNDGRVLVVGGSSNFTTTHPIGWPASVASPQATTEIWSPLTRTWSAGPLLPAPLTMPDAILLGSGKVLIIGGVKGGAAGQVAQSTGECYLFDPSTDQIAPTDFLPRGRLHTGNVRMANGDGMIAGGTTIDFSTQSTTVFNDAFKFDALTELWSGLPSIPALIRCGHLICVDDGMGGVYYILGNGLTSLDLATGTAVYQKNVYSIDSNLASWSLVGTLNQDQMGAAMVGLENADRVLFLGPGSGLAQPNGPKSDIMIR